MSAIDVIPRLPRVRACDRFEGYGKFCRACAWSRRMHQRTVGCSQCGAQFMRYRNEGYSHCDQHTPVSK